MAHFAELNENNIVVNVYVIMNQDIMDENNVEQETLGIELCKQLYGQNKKFLQTSYNHNFRKKYAIIGDVFDESYNAFITPPQFPSFIFNTEELSWDPPVPYPDDPNPDNIYIWNEDILNWELQEY